MGTVRRRRESGQVLIGALLFIAFFAIVTVSVFRFADVGQVQHAQTEATVTTDAPIEAAGLFAEVDGSRSDNTCVPGLTGNLTFKTGETVTYKVASPNGCNFGTGGPGGPGSNCQLCVLDPSGATLCPGGNSFCSDGTTTLDGEIDINGDADLKNKALLCSLKVAADMCAHATGFIGVSGTAGGGGTYDPTPTTISAITDPLANTFLLPVGITAAGSITAGVATPNAVYTDLSNAILPAGIYVVTGTVKTGLVSMGGVTIVLACSKSTSPFWQSCAKAASTNGGSVSLAGLDTMVISPPSTGPYANLALFGDPLNTNTISLHGNGIANLTGTIYAPSMTLDVQGNGTSFANGRLVVGVVKNLGSGGPGLNVGGSVPTSISCNVINDVLSVNGTQNGHAVIQTSCNGGSEIVNFDYTP